MKVGRQHKWVALRPVHDRNGLWLSGIRGEVKAVRKVSVKVKIITVVPTLDATDISCTHMCITDLQVVFIQSCL